MSRTRYLFHENEYPYFITCTVVGWLPVFTRKECVEILFDSWKYLQANRNLSLFSYVILENHLHAIISSDKPGTDIGDFKSFTARKIIDYLTTHREFDLLRQIEREKASHKTDRKYQFWQEGSHPQQITTSKIFEQKMEYIHNNPVTRGYVEVPEHWLYSSARNLAGLSAKIVIDEYLL